MIFIVFLINIELFSQAQHHYVVLVQHHYVVLVQHNNRVLAQHNNRVLVRICLPLQSTNQKNLYQILPHSLHLLVLYSSPINSRFDLLCVSKHFQYRLTPFIHFFIRILVLSKNRKI